MTEHNIRVWTTSKVSPFRAIYSASIIISVIGVGVLAESSAMQWAGFWSLVLTVVGLAVIQTVNEKALTIEQARAYLDELERKEKETSCS